MLGVLNVQREREKEMDDHLQQELDTYYERVQQDVVANHEEPVEHFVVCTSMDGSFRSRSLRILENGNKVEMTYYVIHCDPDNHLYTTLYTLPPDTEFSMRDVMDKFFHLLWTHTVCSECYRPVELVENTMTAPLCPDCYPVRMFFLWGMLHQKTETIPMCCICLEPVFHSRLRCGHMVHKTCFIRVGNHRWFHQDNEYHCPMCRTKITRSDQQNYFLYY